MCGRLIHGTRQNVEQAHPWRLRSVRPEVSGGVTGWKGQEGGSPGAGNGLGFELDDASYADTFCS